MKSYAAVLACVLMLAMAFAAVTVNSVSAQGGPQIPSWVHPGVTVVYDAVSAFVQNGRFTQGIQVVMTTRVNSVSGGVVNAVTNAQTVGSPIGGPHAWSCNAAGNCRTDATGLSGQFWVDPANPAASTHGVNGEVYSLMGAAPYPLNGKTWAASTLSYQNQASGVQLMTVFETKSGLVIAHSETYPTQQVHSYIRTISGQ
jgi:hypothetical protein